MKKNMKYDKKQNNKSGVLPDVKDLLIGSKILGSNIFI